MEKILFKSKGTSLHYNPGDNTGILSELVELGGNSAIPTAFKAFNWQLSWETSTLYGRILGGMDQIISKKLWEKVTALNYVATLP